MFDLFIIALLQFATLTGTAPANKIGGSGWENDAAPASKKIGGSGWENDVAPTSSKIGGSGWENDYTR
jgi:hypothetical protein